MKKFRIKINNVLTKIKFYVLYLFLYQVSPSTKPTFLPSLEPTVQPTRSPSRSPSKQPTFFPTILPSCTPSGRPSDQPSLHPSHQPTREPILLPSVQPTTDPTTKPSAIPSSLPLTFPSCYPSSAPSSEPSSLPTCLPSKVPTSVPSKSPTIQPSGQPMYSTTIIPSVYPTVMPSSMPLCPPTAYPSRLPTQCPSLQPSLQPYDRPTVKPNHRPSLQPLCPPSTEPALTPTSEPSTCPTIPPSGYPSNRPNYSPSSKPSIWPTDTPSVEASLLPVIAPTFLPTGSPVSDPTRQPTLPPSSYPSSIPTYMPYNLPSMEPTSTPTALPTILPLICPSQNPSSIPSTLPNRRPSRLPSCQPSRQPRKMPTLQPKKKPSSQPSHQPSRQPSKQPLGMPTKQPIRKPFSRPSRQPIANIPTRQPSHQPSRSPSYKPTRQPVHRPSRIPSSDPTTAPSLQPNNKVPTKQPTKQPIWLLPTSMPSLAPILIPSAQPFRFPVCQPSVQPSRFPTTQPLDCPSKQPSKQPFINPSRQPLRHPSSQPSVTPSTQPSYQPFLVPSAQPSRIPSASPTVQPQMAPSRNPSFQPLCHPTFRPIPVPTLKPLCVPSTQPSSIPLQQPSMQPSKLPTSQPICQPSDLPSRKPIRYPSNQPSRFPSILPSRNPSKRPVDRPSRLPSQQPIGHPSRFPSSQPRKKPIVFPSPTPTKRPTWQPSNSPTSQPVSKPSRHPSAQPRQRPLSRPTMQPIIEYPSCHPSKQPSIQPSTQPQSLPSSQPIVAPSAFPTFEPTQNPSRTPSQSPTAFPSNIPSLAPTFKPLNAPSRTPSIEPSTEPFAAPKSFPTTPPSSKPSFTPTNKPTIEPVVLFPTIVPSSRPMATPTNAPSQRPTLLYLQFTSCQPQSTDAPTIQPFIPPSVVPLQSTVSPTNQSVPSTMPSLLMPTQEPKVPTWTPTLSISFSPHVDLSRSVSRDQIFFIEQSLFALLKSNQTQNVLYSYFEEILYGGSIAMGGATAFSVYLRSELRTTLFQSSIRSISYYYQVSGGVKNVRFDSKSCSDPNTAGKIVSFLVNYGGTDLDSYIPSMYFCGIDSWVMNFCGVEKILKLCINCVDPCSSLSGNRASAFPFMCNVTGACVSILQVGFDDNFPPAKILSVRPLSISKQQIIVNISLSSAFSYVYCMALPTSQVEPSLQVLLTQPSQLAVDTATTVSIYHLIPSTYYAIYCTTQSQDARVLVSSEVQYLVAKTSCCKRVLVSVTSSYVASQVLYYAIVRLVFSAAPSSSLSIHAYLKAHYITHPQGSNFCNFSPLYLSSTSHIGAGSAYFMSLQCNSSALGTGNYSISISLSGPSTNEFVVHSQSYLALIVVGEGMLSSAGPPSFVAAIYDNSGISLSVQFSSSTNKALLPSLFPCSELFSFDFVDGASCQWLDGSSLRVIFHGGRSPSIGSVITLPKTDSVRHLAAACPRRYDCSSWQTISENSSLRIQAASSPIEPTIVLSGPAEIDICSQFEIDLSASYGSAGKRWLNFTVTVSSSTPGSSLSELLSSIERDAADSVGSSSYLFLHLRAGLLSAVTTYSFHFIACNWMERCSSATFFTAHYNRNGSVPTASIIGPGVRYMNVYNDLTLNGLVQASPCAHSSIIFLSWEIYQGGVKLDLQNYSNDSSKYFLPGFSLSPHSSYLVRLLSEEVPGRSAVFAAAVEVVVNGISSADLVPIITQGSKLSLSVGKQVILNGSLSYDRTLHPALQSRDSTLAFSWDCIAKSSNVSNSCELLSLRPAGKDRRYSSVSIEADATAALVGSVYSIILTISKGITYNKAVITLQIVPFVDDSCTVAIAPLRYGGYDVSVGQKLRLSASGVAKKSKTLSWSSTGLDITLASAGVTSRVLNLNADTSNNYPFTFDLSILANTFHSGTPYTVTLTCSPLGEPTAPAAYASIDIFPNQPPLPGVFLITPQSGIELTDTFSMYALQWYSEQLPLYYQFGFKSPGTGYYLIAQLKSELSYTFRMLPSGDPVQSFSLLCILDVFDSIGSNVSAVNHVDVFASEKNVLKTLNDSIFTERSISLHQLSIYSTHLNQANCSLSPNCSSLHRQPCITTDFTCGPCLPSFIGQSGDSNSMCIVPLLSAYLPGTTRLLSNMTLLCASDSDCGIFQLCRGGVCQSLPRDCPNNCSGYGNCSYVQTRTGLPTNSCTYYDTACLAVCTCATSYAGLACSTSKSHYMQLESVRCSMIRSLWSSIQRSNADPNALYSWINLLNSLAFHADEISSCTTTIFEVVKYTLRRSTAVHVPYESMQLLSRAFDSLLASSDSSYVEILSLMGLWVSTISSGLIASQSLQSIDSRFRYLTLSAFTTDGQVVLDPKFSYELSVNYVVLNVSSPQMDGWVTCTVIETQAALVQSYGVDSNHITVLLTNVSSISLLKLKSFKPTIVLENIRPVNDLEIFTASNYSTLCRGNEVSTHTYKCQAGPQPITVQCNGQAAIIKTFCPSRRYSTYCENVIHTDSDSLSACSKDGSALSVDRTMCSCEFKNYSSVLNAHISIAAGVRTELLYTPSTVSVIQNPTTKPYNNVVGAMFISILLVIYSLLSLIAWQKKYLRFFTSNKVCFKSYPDNNSITAKSEPLWIDKELLMTSQGQGFSLKDIIAAAIPKGYFCPSMFDSVFTNLKSNSKYCSFLFGNENAQVRGWVLILTSWNLTIFFMTVLIAGLSDTSRCNSIHSSLSCAAALSRLYDSDRACKWNPATSSCIAVSTGSGYVTFYKLYLLVLWSLLLTSPAIFLITYFLHENRHSTTEDSQETPVESSKSSDTTLHGIESSSANLPTTVHESLNNFVQQSQKSMSVTESAVFVQNLNRYFTKYQAYKLYMYNRTALDPAGAGAGEEAALTYSAEHFAEVLQVVSDKACAEFATVRSLSPREQGTHLFSLLIEDLLPATSAAIVSRKRLRDRSQSIPIQLSSVRALALVSINVALFAICGVLLSLESYGEQILLLYSFLLWIAVDCLLVDLAYVLVADVWVPSWATRDLSMVLGTIQSAVVEPYISSIAERIHNKNRALLSSTATIPAPGNFASIFMPSVHVASLLPHLREARMIKGFQTERSTLKGIFQFSEFKSNADSSMWVRPTRSSNLLLKSFMDCDPNLQELIIRLFCVGLSAAYLLLHSALFNASPPLVLVPTALTLFIMYTVQCEEVKIQMYSNDSFYELVDGANIPAGLGLPWMDKLSSPLYIVRTAAEFEVSKAPTSRCILPQKIPPKPFNNVLSALVELKEDHKSSSEEDDTDSSSAAEESHREEMADSDSFHIEIDSRDSNSTGEHPTLHDAQSNNSSESDSGSQPARISSLGPKLSPVGLSKESTNFDREWLTIPAQNKKPQPSNTFRPTTFGIAPGPELIKVLEHETIEVADISIHEPRSADNEELSIGATSVQSIALEEISFDDHSALSSLQRRVYQRSAWPRSQLDVRLSSSSLGESLPMMVVPRMSGTQINWSPQRGEDYLVHPSPEAVELPLDPDAMIFSPWPQSPTQLSGYRHKSETQQGIRSINIDDSGRSKRK